MSDSLHSLHTPLAAADPYSEDDLLPRMATSLQQLQGLHTS